jgi:hypothetical protein
LSDRDLGLGPRAQQETNIFLHVGVSTYNRRDRCEKKARRFPGLGSHVVELQIPDDAAVEVHRTLDNGHYSVVGDADLLLSFCVADSCLAVPAQDLQGRAQPSGT